MIQRDIIKDQIEQLGRVLGKILGYFIENIANGNINEVVAQTNQKLQGELNLDIDKLIQFEPDELEEYVDSLRLTDAHLDQLSKYLFDVGVYKKNDFNRVDSKKYLNSAMMLLELAEKKSSTFCLERNNLKNEIGEQLKYLIQD